MKTTTDKHNRPIRRGDLVEYRGRYLRVRSVDVYGWVLAGSTGRYFNARKCVRV